MNFGRRKMKKKPKRRDKLGEKAQKYEKPFKINVKDVGGRLSSLWRLMIKLVLTSQAVNVEQTVPGKPCPNDRPSEEKNKGGAFTRTPFFAARLCFMKAGSKRKCVSSFRSGFLMQTGSLSHADFCIQDSLHSFVSHPHFDYKTLVL